MKVVVSGGLGFIGTYLVRSYASDGAEVVVLDNVHPQVHQDLRNREIIQPFARVLIGDVRDPDACDRALKGADLVLHMAAETGTSQSMVEIRRYCDVNVTGTATLLEAARRQGVKKIFLPSSRAVYGEGRCACPKHGIVQPSPRPTNTRDFRLRCSICGNVAMGLPTPETWTTHPISVYGTTKLAQEYIVSQACSMVHIDARIARYQNVYGPGQSLGNTYAGVLAYFGYQALHGHEIILFEDGRISRDFIYIDDAVAASRAVIDLDVNPGPVNIGTGTPTTLVSVVGILERALNLQLPWRISGEFRQGDVQYAAADIGKLQSIGFTARTPLAIGLASLLSDIKTRGSQ